jgi:hypothetical protein
MERVSQSLLDIKALSSASVIVCHHFGKAKSGDVFHRLRGSSVIYARSETALEIRALKFRDGGLDSFGVIPQARKGRNISPFRVRLEENGGRLTFKNDGEYKPVSDPELDRLSHMVVHLFLLDKEERTVYDVKEKMAGMGSDSEIREALRTLHKMKLLKVKQSGKSHRFMYSPVDNLSCSWCGSKR